jgi:hypothetical protein
MGFSKAYSGSASFLAGMRGADGGSGLAAPNDAPRSEPVPDDLLFPLEMLEVATPTTLAERVNLPLADVGRQLDELEKLELVRAEPPEASGDDAESLYRLTEYGLKAVRYRRIAS